MKALLLVLLVPLSAFSATPWPGNLTVLSRVEAESIYREISHNSEIPYAFPDGCHAKAQKIALLLDEKNIVSGKAFVEGSIFHNEPGWGDQLWLFHVAPVVLVESLHQPEPFIIDPFLAKKLVTFSEWRDLLAKDHRTKLGRTFFTNRFVYDPPHALENPVEYNLSYIQDMELMFKQMWERLKNRSKVLRQKLSR